MSEVITYQAAGVDHAGLDWFKRACLEGGRRTAVSPRNLEELGIKPLEWSRGESAYLLEYPESWPGHISGHVLEGLGTKNMIADGLLKVQRGKRSQTYYDSLAQDTFAMGDNDLSTLGVRSVLAHLYLGTGSAKWLQKHREEAEEFIEGFTKACIYSGCVWGGGETPALPMLINQRSVVFNVAVSGVLPHKELVLRSDHLRPGMRIIFLRSSGLHANGASLPRKLVREKRASYLDVLENGMTFGEALLEPTHLYGPVVTDLIEAGAIVGKRIIEYAANITGGGFKKIMRAEHPYCYIIERLPTPNPLFAHIQQRSGNTDRQMYETFNMDVGFVVFCDSRRVDLVYQYANRNGQDAIDAGYVDRLPKGVSSSQVVIEPLNSLTLTKDEH